MLLIQLTGKHSDKTGWPVCNQFACSQRSRKQGGGVSCAPARLRSRLSNAKSQQEEDAGHLTALGFGEKQNPKNASTMVLRKHAAVRLTSVQSLSV